MLSRYILAVGLVAGLETGCARRRTPVETTDGSAVTTASASPSSVHDAALIPPKTIFTGAFEELAGIDRIHGTFLLGTRGSIRYQNVAVTSGYSVIGLDGRVRSHLDLPARLPAPQADGLALGGSFEVFVNDLEKMARGFTSVSPDDRGLSLFIGLDPDPRKQDNTRQPVELNLSQRDGVWISGLLGHECWPLDRQTKRFTRREGCSPPIVYPWWDTSTRCFRESPTACCDDCKHGNRWCWAEGCIFFGERAAPAPFWITDPSPPHSIIVRGRVRSSMPSMARSAAGNVLLTLFSGDRFVTAILEPKRTTARTLRHRPRHAMYARAAWLDDVSFVLVHDHETEAPLEAGQSYGSIDNKLELWRLDHPDDWTNAPEVSDLVWTERAP